MKHLSNDIGMCQNTTKIHKLNRFLFRRKAFSFDWAFVGSSRFEEFELHGGW